MSEEIKNMNGEVKKGWCKKCNQEVVYVISEKYPENSFYIFIVFLILIFILIFITMNCLGYWASLWMLLLFFPLCNTEEKVYHCIRCGNIGRIIDMEIDKSSKKKVKEKYII